MAGAAQRRPRLVYGEPAEQLVLAGVTGTNGKTTTAWIMRHLLATHQAAALIGTLGSGWTRAAQ